MRRTALLILLILASYGVARPATAAMSCSASISDINFGSFDVLPGTEVDSTGSGILTCSGAAPNTTYRFCLDIRKGPDASGNQRYMSNGSQLLPFNLYADAAHTQPAGNWVDPYLGGGIQLDIPSNGSGNIYAAGTFLYADVPGGQQAAVPSAYSEYIANVSTQGLYYGATPSAGSCPVGSSEYQFGFHVYATVITNCNVGSATLSFPAASVLSASTTATGSIAVQCTDTTPYSVGLDNGSHASGSQRRMYSAATGSYVSYNLYTNSADSQAWSGGSSATACTNGAGTCYLGTGTGAVQNIPVYGVVPPQVSPAPGSYNDSVVVTVTY